MGDRRLLCSLAKESTVMFFCLETFRSSLKRAPDAGQKDVQRSVPVYLCSALCGCGWVGVVECVRACAIRPSFLLLGFFFFSYFFKPVVCHGAYPPLVSPYCFFTVSSPLRLLRHRTICQSDAYWHNNNDALLQTFWRRLLLLILVL